LTANNLGFPCRWGQIKIESEERKMKRITQKTSLKAISIILVAMLAFACIAGCGGSGSQPADSTQQQTGQPSAPSQPQQQQNEKPAAESKVVVGLVADPQNIGPFQGMSQGRIGVLYTIYECLVTHKGCEIYGITMKDYEKIDDLTYNCEIYDYVYDHAGNNVTAEDVAFSYNTAMKSGNLPKLGSIESVTAIDKYVVQFKFNKLSIGDLGALWMECPIVTKAAYESSPDQMATKPISTSAYACTEFVPGSKMVFTKTGNYWQKDKSKIQYTSMHNVDVIEFDIIPDSAQLTNALKTKSIDVTNWLSDVDVDDFRNVEGYGVTPVPDNLTYFIVFNCDAKLGKFKDNAKLRQAIAYAIDPKQIVDGAFKGNGNVAKTIGNTNYSDYVQKWLNEDYYDTDINKAKQLLAEAGGNGLNVNLMIVAGEVTNRIATIIQNQLSQIGVNVKINAYDSQLYNEYKYKPDQWDILLDQGGSTSYLVNVWKLGWDNTGYVHGGAVNFVKDPKLQSLLETAMKEETHNEASMDAFHQYLKEQCYGYGLCQSMANIAHTSKITEIVVDARRQVIPGACEYSF